MKSGPRGRRSSHPHPALSGRTKRRVFRFLKPQSMESRASHSACQHRCHDRVINGRCRDAPSMTLCGMVSSHRSCVFGSAPRSINKRATLSLPAADARCKAVSLPGAFKSTAAPWSNSSRTISRCPFWDVECSGARACAVTVIHSCTVLK